MLDCQHLYFDLLAFREAKGLTNLVFEKSTLRSILEQGSIELLCLDEQLRLTSLNGAGPVHALALAILQKYAVAYYDRQRRAWEQERVELFSLQGMDANLNWESYKVRVPPELADFARDLATKASELRALDEARYPHIHFDRHLYQPLLVQAGDDDRIIAMEPPGLNEGETRLVADLRATLRAATSQPTWASRHFFLLRNLSRQGVSFFDATEGSAFYPDFILWILEENCQRIAFVDPHGLRNERWGSPKLTLFELLQNEWQPRLNARTPDWEIRLTSFVVSPEAYGGPKLDGSWVRDHTEEAFAERHVFFQDDAKPRVYVRRMIEGMLAL